jgi:hypothetical protein
VRFVVAEYTRDNQRAAQKVTSKKAESQFAPPIEIIGGGGGFNADEENN